MPNCKYKNPLQHHISSVFFRSHQKWEIWVAHVTTSPMMNPTVGTSSSSSPSSFNRESLDCGGVGLLGRSQNICSGILMLAECLWKTGHFSSTSPLSSHYQSHGSTLSTLQLFLAQRNWNINRQKKKKKKIFCTLKTWCLASLKVISSKCFAVFRVK